MLASCGRRTWVSTSRTFARPHSASASARFTAVGGLAVAGLRARHDHDLRPADLEQVVAQHAERRAALGVGIDHEREPRIGLLVGQVVLGQVDLAAASAADGLACGGDHHGRLAERDRRGRRS